MCSKIHKRQGALNLAGSSPRQGGGAVDGLAIKVYLAGSVARRPRASSRQPQPSVSALTTPILAERAELKKAGLKATLPRLKILSVLEQHADLHMSAEDVYRALMMSGDEVGLATIYRVLTQFEGAGLVIRHNFAEGHAVFELDSGEHHDHIVCADCGEVIEFIDATIERRQTQIAKQHGFELTDHSLVLHGHCRRKDCPKREVG